MFIRPVHHLPINPCHLPHDLRRGKPTAACCSRWWPMPLEQRPWMAIVSSSICYVRRIGRMKSCRVATQKHRANVFSVGPSLHMDGVLKMRCHWNDELGIPLYFYLWKKTLGDMACCFVSAWLEMTNRNIVQLKGREINPAGHSCARRVPGHVHTTTLIPVRHSLYHLHSTRSLNPRWPNYSSIDCMPGL